MDLKIWCNEVGNFGIFFDTLSQSYPPIYLFFQNCRKEEIKKQDDSGGEVIIALKLQIVEEAVVLNLSSGVVMWFR